MDIPYTSSHLCHFVGWQNPNDDEANWGTLSTILDRKCVSHKPHVPGYGTTKYAIDLSKRLFSEDLVVPTVTCFGDIPESSLGLHVSKYGHFGLTFDRAFLIRQGARPVTYVPMTATDWMGPVKGRLLLDDIEAIYKGFVAHREQRSTEIGRSESRSLRQTPSTEADLLRCLTTLLEMYFLAYVKPFDAELPAEDRHSFYMEREWRKFGNLCFEFDDVVQVWVASGYAERVKDAYPMFANKVKECPARPPA